MDFKFEGEDSRGKVWSFKIGDVEYILFYTKKGGMRGGDYHSKRQYNIVLSGAIGLTILSKIFGEIPLTLKEGQSIAIQEEIPHYMISLTDSYVLEWHELPKTRKIYEPYRKIVMESIKNGKK